VCTTKDLPRQQLGVGRGPAASSSQRTSPRGTSHQEGVAAVMPCNQQRTKHYTTARSQAAHDAFRQALLQGAHRPQFAKLGLVGAARAGKTSTLRALAGQPLRPDEESTVGLAVWQVTQELLTPGHGLHWQLQAARAHKKAARWDSSVAQYVANNIVPHGGCATGHSDGKVLPGGGLDASVLKRMPVDLIAQRLEDDGQVAESLVFETYDFGGQEIYYAMHHLFLTDYGLYLACIDLTTVDQNGKDEASGTEASLCSMDALEWWLASIVINAPSSPVAIVGTHDDCLDCATRPRVHRTLHERIVALCTKIPELNARLQLNEDNQLCFFPVDNSTGDAGSSIHALRKAIKSMASELLDGPLCQPVPLRWGHFWATLQRAPSDEKLKPLCRLDELWKRCSQYGFANRAEMTAFLQHFCSLGALLHFPDSQAEDLRDTVCFDPSWVAEAAACVLLAKDRVLQGCTRHTVELQEKGLLHCQLLDAIWRQPPFRRHKPQLIELLQVLDLLMPWGYDRQSIPISQHAEMPQVFLVPALLPPRPQRQVAELRSEQIDEDGVVLFLDFQGLLDRLLPTLFPRLLCTLRRIEAAVQIVTIYSNYALFALPTHGQAQGDSARSQGIAGGQSKSQKLMVSLQPCAGGDLLRCCIRPRKDASASQVAKCSWRAADRILHAFKDAVGAWMPRISFKAGIRCPICRIGPAHPVDLHALLRDEVACCPHTGEPVEDEDLPQWLSDWRRQLQVHSVEVAPVVRDGADAAPSDSAGLQLDYLYSSPLDTAQLDVVAELRALECIPSLEGPAVRTATTETLVDVWAERACQGDCAKWRVLCLAAHCAVDMSRPHPTRCPALLLEDSSGCSQAVSPMDLIELLRGLKSGSNPYDVVVLDACHSLPFGECFLEAGADAVVVCDGAVFDAAGRAFLGAFMRSLATGEESVDKAFSTARRAVKLSPQPGLRAEAAKFRLLRRDEPLAAEDCAQQRPRLTTGLGVHRQPSGDGDAMQHLPSLGRLPPAVEDFVGRSRLLATVAQAFLGGRRAVWLHGPPGIGKTAVASEFCRFYGFVGDRLFSQSCYTKEGGALFIDLHGLQPHEAVHSLRSALRSPPASQDEARGNSCRAWLLALDGLDEIVSCAGCSSEEVPSGAMWRLLSEALSGREGLRLLLVSREPRYDAPLPCKVVAHEVPSLLEADAAMLFLRRVHRPLYSRDFDAAASTESSSEPPVLAGRKQELVQRLVGHPLLDCVGCAPGDIIAAASEVTPTLTSLLQHPSVKLGKRSSSSQNVGISLSGG